MFLGALRRLLSSFEKDGSEERSSLSESFSWLEDGIKSGRLLAPVCAVVTEEVVGVLSKIGSIKPVKGGPVGDGTSSGTANLGVGGVERW